MLPALLILKQHLRLHYRKPCNKAGLFHLLYENMKKQGYGKVLARLVLYNKAHEGGTFNDNDCNRTSKVETK